jgi:NADH-quinone oxidoreductase subunit N
MSLNDLLVNLNLIMPITVLTAWACVLLLVDLFIPKERKGITALLAALGLLVALALVISRAGVATSAFNGMIMIDGFATFMSVIFLFSGLAGIAVAYDYLMRSGIERGEYYVLLLFSIVGMMLMAAAADLIMVFLALELLSIPLYVLAGIAVPRPDSEEAALKYFLLGAFASGFFLYGTALVYGATGSIALTEIVSATSSGNVNLSFLVIGAGLILVGLGFKVAVVPFHMWTPDVYQGAPSSVTAFMAVGAKAAGFAALLRIFVLAFPSLAMDLTPVLWVLAAFTMVIGNVIAIAQRNIKRMLAYSSIAHAGYIMMALVPYGQGDISSVMALVPYGQGDISSDTVASALFYLLAYMLTSFAAWAVVIALEHNIGEGRDTDGLSLEDYSGLGQKQPALAAAMTVAMLSFIGIPPTLGFVGKFYLLRTVIEGGFPGLALIGLLTSLVSAYYYLRVVVYMYMRDGEPVVRREPWLYFTALATAVGVVVLSIFSEPLFNWASQAVLKLI